MANIMGFPATVDEFMESYKVVDTDHVYSNGTEFVPIFRMKQWFEHAADVAPVVTCADCKYNKREVTDLWGNDAIQCITGQTHSPDWFCADGKKREEN